MIKPNIRAELCAVSRHTEGTFFLSCHKSAPSDSPVSVLFANTTNPVQAPNSAGAGLQQPGEHLATRPSHWAPLFILLAALLVRCPAQLVVLRKLEADQLVYFYNCQCDCYSPDHIDGSQLTQLQEAMVCFLSSSSTTFIFWAHFHSWQISLYVSKSCVFFLIG